MSTYADIRRRVAASAGDGDRPLTITDLAAASGAAPEAVREALLRLVEEEVLEPAGADGDAFRRVRLDVRTARELFHVRSLLEAEAAALAAMADLELDVLRDLDCMARDSSAQGASGSGSGADGEAFHVSLARASGSRRLVRMLSELVEELAPYVHAAALHAGPADLATLRAGHVAITEAVKRGDPDRARAEARSHLAAAQMLVLDSLIAGNAEGTAHVDADIVALPARDVR